MGAEGRKFKEAKRDKRHNNLQYPVQQQAGPTQKCNFELKKGAVECHSPCDQTISNPSSQNLNFVASSSCQMFNDRVSSNSNEESPSTYRKSVRKRPPVRTTPNDCGEIQIVEGRKDAAVVSSCLLNNSSSKVKSRTIPIGGVLNTQ